MEGPPFNWASPLGVGVALLLGGGALNTIIGVLAPVVGRGRVLVADILVLSPGADAALFGADPNALVREFPPLLALQRVLIVWLGASLATFGLLVIAVTWFGLRRGEPWALPVLPACWLLVLAEFPPLFRRYPGAGVALSLWGPPPLSPHPPPPVSPPLPPTS